MIKELLNEFISLFYSDLFVSIITTLLGTAFIWLPILLIFMAITLWMRYRRRLYLLRQGSVLLEIVLPAEVTRSPLAMEVFFTALYQTGTPQNLIETYLDGRVPPWFSLELVSLEGEIHFYIWTWLKYKNLIEAQLYAHYPNVEVLEVEDYSTGVYQETKNLSMWGTYFKLTSYR